MKRKPPLVHALALLVGDMVLMDAASSLGLIGSNPGKYKTVGGTIDYLTMMKRLFDYKP